MVKILVMCCVFSLDVPPLNPLRPQPGKQLPHPKAEQLSAETKKEIRNTIVKEGVFLGTQRTGRSFIEVVSIPKVLQDAYSKQPRAVIEFLLTIAEDGDAVDSMKAVAYAISLLDSPARGVACVRLFDESKYDVRLNGRETLRQYWIGEVKELLHPKKRD